MSEEVCAVLLALTYLSIKHTVGDFFLQTAYQFKNKGTYGHPGGILHSAIHVLLTIPVFAILAPASVLAGAAIIAGEFIVHYHVDWTKEQVNKRFQLTQTDYPFWYLFGSDQLAHLLTYAAIVAILVS